MNAFIASVTVLSILLIIYHHAIYPILLKIILRRSATASLDDTAPRHYGAIAEDENSPSVTVLIPAYNEAKYIADKIRNLACLDYPKEKLNIIIACDGCSDDTAKISLQTSHEDQCQHLRITVKEFAKNRGKIAILNDVMTEIDSDLVAFSDVSSLVSIDALIIAAQRFQTASIGAINGNYRLLYPNDHGEASYWKYQSAIKTGEERLGSVMGAHGAFYMLRTHLFRPLGEDCINDDFIIPMRVVELGYKVAYEPRLNALEMERSSSTLDWKRRLRISYGNAQQLAILRHLLLPKYRGVAFTFLSGKALRVTMPYFMIVSFVGCWLLSNTPIFALAAVLQTMVYALAGLAHLLGAERSGKLLNTAHYIVVGHIANLIGSLCFIFKTKTIAW